MNERDRMLQVMQSVGMNAKQFCQEVGISQGTLSNIMGGRNKPSLDVMQSILRRFRAISCDWLIMGVGTMYSAAARESGQQVLFADEETEECTAAGSSLQAANNHRAEAALPTVSQVTASVSNTRTEPVVEHAIRTVQKVMIFYSDGTFEER
jgi:transcriptional regulator with XRE-family HTH domain